MAVRVPMSVGKLKEDYDKSIIFIQNIVFIIKFMFIYLIEGDICKVVDVIINPNVA